MVPPKLQETVLSELHEGHSGIVQMKSIARTHVWWPHIDQHIERIAKSCDACQRNKKAPPYSVVTSMDMAIQAHAKSSRRFCRSFYGKDIPIDG